MLIRKAVEIGLYEEVKVEIDKIGVSHLQYVDETVFTFLRN